MMEEEAVETEGVETTEDEVVEHEVGLEVEWFCISGIGGIIWCVPGRVCAFRTLTN